MEYTEDDIVQLAIEAGLVFNTDQFTDGQVAFQWHIDRLVKFAQLLEEKYLSETKG